MAIENMRMDSSEKERSGGNVMAKVDKTTEK